MYHRIPILGLLALVCMAGVARADEDAPACIPIAEAVKQLPGLIDAKPISRDQFWFVFGIYLGSPQTPPGIPHGDKAVIFEHDGHDAVLFIDGEMACERLALLPHGKEIFDDIGAGKVNHFGSAL